MVLGPFAETKRTSAAGPKPGIYCECQSLRKCHGIYGLHMILERRGGMNLKMAYSLSRIRMNTESDMVAFCSVLDSNEMT